MSEKLQPDWIAPGRTAVVVIDMQVDFGSPDGEMARRGADVSACQDAVKQAETLVNAARAAHVPVMFVRLLTHPGGENRIIRESKQRQQDDKPDLCVEGEHGADFIGPQPAPARRSTPRPISAPSPAPVWPSSCTGRASTRWFWRD